MSDMETEIGALRTRVGALRSVIARIVVLLPEAERQALCDWLVLSSMAPDGQEDPGAVTVRGVPTGMARAVEMDEILALVRRYETGD